MARKLANLAVFVLPASVLTLPVNLLPFGVLLLVSSLLVVTALRKGWQKAGAWRWGLLLASVGVVAVGCVSLVLNDEPARRIDNLSRLLVIPWILAWLGVLRPSFRSFWRGAVAGMLGVTVLAIWQFSTGMERVDGWTNAIVMADVAVVLLALVLFCRPVGRGWPVLWTCVAGCALVLLLSGSRGAWPAMLLLLAGVFLGSSWSDLQRRVLVLLVAGGLLFAALFASPQLREQVRMHEFGEDLARMEMGDADSSAGARLRLWKAAADAFVENPWTGVGIGRFEVVVERLPECMPVESRGHVCQLDHAHNDLAEWAATAGIWGVIGLLLVYGLPFWLFSRLWARQHCAPRGAAVAGLAVVVVFVICGLTQSMFAHQITAGLYASLVGLLAGWALHQDRRGVGQSPVGRSQAATA